MYADSPPDDCSCRWTNYGDNSGWTMKHRDPKCPHHGDHCREDITHESHGAMLCGLELPCPVHSDTPPEM